MERLAAATPDELAAEDGIAEYNAVAKEMRFEYLGHAMPEALKELLEAPGTLADRRWEQVPFTLPESTLAGCWWLANPARRTGVGTGVGARPSDGATPQFVCRSLAILVAELHQHRVATVVKMSEEMRTWRTRNLDLMEQLTHTRHWRRCGPKRWVEAFVGAATVVARERKRSVPDADKEQEPPSTQSLDAELIADPSAEELMTLANDWENRQPAPEDQDAWAEWAATGEALADLRSTRWEDIHRERFSATPKAVFAELRRSVVPWAEHARDCAARRESRLKERRDRRAATNPPPTGDTPDEVDSDDDTDRALGNPEESADQAADRQAQEFRK